MIKTHLPKSIHTYQGHLKSERQGLQSTKADSINTAQDYFPSSDSPNTKTNEVCYALIDMESESVGYMDLTGRFPKRSSRGNQYILVAYHYDGNYIHGEAVKNRKGSSIAAAWVSIQSTFKSAGSSPTTYVLDNETSQDLLQAFEEEKISHQLVPPHKHRNNKAERAIQTFKSHFKSCLSGTDPNYPLSEWDRLIPQTNITLNLLRASRVNPKLSAYAFINGEYNYRATPMAPPGTKVLVYKHPTIRASWDLNGEPGWYIGPALDHYRCVQCYIPRTKSIVISDTVEFFPTIIKFPSFKLADFIQQAATDMLSILANPPKLGIPSLQAGDDLNNAILEIAKLLKRTDILPTLKAIDDSPAMRMKPIITDPPPRVSTIDNNTPPRVLESKNNSNVIEYDKNEIDISPSQRNLTNIPISRLQISSTLPKNSRFNNKIDHRYNLRSQPHLIQHISSNPTEEEIADRLFNPIYSINHIYNAEGKKETIDSLLEGPNKHIWHRSLSNEWGRLAQGNDAGIKGTDTIRFIPRSAVPQDRKVTYASMVCDYRPLKDEKYRVRITVGGDRLPYDNDAGSPAADLLETKLLINSTISDARKGARFMCLDIKDHFLATPMVGTEYMRAKYKYFPEDIRKKYILSQLVTNDEWIYIEICKGMPGLKQAAILAYQHLKNSLEPYGYTPIPGTIGIWQHTTRPTKFCLCVDDFGVKYWSKSDADHLCNAVGRNYKYTVDMEGKNYCGLILTWNYNLGYVDTEIPKYIPALLKRLKYQPKKIPQHSPHHHIPIKYGPKGSQQLITPTNHKPIPERTKYIQSIAGSLLYYARAIDFNILTALNDIGTTQSKPTEYTLQECEQLLDYAATYPHIVVRYYASDMVLAIDSDAAYLVLPNAKSRIAGYYYLTSDLINDAPPINAPILVICKTLKHVVSSAAEAETAGVFTNAQIALPIRHTLEALGHPQPPTPIKTDNSTATGFVNNNMQQKRSKSWDMRYHWLRDRETQKHIRVYWDKGLHNYADYFTKHHPTSYHLEMRSKNKFLFDK